MVQRKFSLRIILKISQIAIISVNLRTTKLFRVDG
jgi:hypothetical protein